MGWPSQDYHWLSVNFLLEIHSFWALVDQAQIFIYFQLNSYWWFITSDWNLAKPTCWSISNWTLIDNALFRSFCLPGPHLFWIALRFLLGSQYFGVTAGQTQMLIDLSIKFSSVFHYFGALARQAQNFIGFLSRSHPKFHYFGDLAGQHFIDPHANSIWELIILELWLIRPRCSSLLIYFQFGKLFYLGFGFPTLDFHWLSIILSSKISLFRSSCWPDPDFQWIAWLCIWGSWFWISGWPGADFLWFSTRCISKNSLLGIFGWQSLDIHAFFKVFTKVEIT